MDLARYLKYAQRLTLTLLAVGVLATCAHLAVPQEKGAKKDRKGPAKKAKEEPAKKGNEKEKEDENLRLYQRDPYDELHLREGVDGVEIIKVRRLEIEKLPVGAQTRVEVVLLADGEKYRIPRNRIIAWKRFPELILEEAERLVAEGDFDEAYYYYAYLRRAYAEDLPQLKHSIAAYHVEEAKTYLPQRQYAQALALLNAAYDIDPMHAGLDDTMAGAVEGLIRGHVKLERYGAARVLLASLKRKFPSHPVVTKWEKQLTGEAQKLFDEALAHEKAGRDHEAREQAYASVRIWPLPAATKLLEAAQRRSPRLVVGVTLLAHAFNPERLDDWAARRSGRLLHRTLLEFTGHGPQGGQYRCPVGQQLVRENFGQRLVLHVNPNVGWSGGRGGLTGADICRHLQAMANPHDHQAFRRDWAEVFASASVRDVYEVQITLGRTHVHPDGLLQTVLVPWYARDEVGKGAPTIGPYRLHAVEAGEIRYRANEGYYAAGSQQPQEVIERYMPDGRSAVSALRNGEIAVLDRVNPWDVEKLRAVEYLRVEPYAVPTVHCLIPNPRHMLLARRFLRRAILAGISRERILRELLRGSKDRGDLVVSGPFPKGKSGIDPTGYAYDYDLEDQKFDRGLAVMLVHLAVARENAIRKSQNKKPMDALKPLVLLHPPHDVARVACRAIRDQLKIVGLEIELKEQSPDERAADENYDLKYTELAMWEPIIDAPRLLGPGGIGAKPSAYLVQALRELNRKNDWKEARLALLEIHRLAAEELPVIPLWQLTDHFAYHRDLKGLAARPVSLYQNIEAWQSPPAVLNLAVKQR